MIDNDEKFAYHEKKFKIQAFTLIHIIHGKKIEWTYKWFNTSIYILKRVWKYFKGEYC